MDIEDIIKAIAPFAFIIFWVVSSVLGSIKQGQPAKTSRPVFTPTKPVFNPKPASNPSPSVWETLRLDPEDEDDGEASPWRTRRQVQMDSETQPAPETSTYKQLRQFMEQRFAEAKAASAKPEPSKAFGSDEGGERQSVNYNQSVGANLSHLVSDHSADVHLEKIQMGAAAVVTRMPEGPYADLVSRLRNPQSARDALVMSIVLSEPKSKQSR
jgi:hypothetical protein